MSSIKGFSDTSQVLAAFEEALRFWSILLTANDGDLKKSVPPATIADPLAELSKTTKLIKAHTTKVGIVFEPSKIASSGSATHSTVSDLSKTFILFISAFSSISASKVSELFYQEIRSVCGTLVNSAMKFIEELREILGGHREGKEGEREGKEREREGKEGEKEKVEEEEKERKIREDHNFDQRLVSVGKIWNTCDDLVKLIEGGKLKFLEKKSKMHLSLIEDGLEEFEQWTEDPNNFDDDPFGLDDFSDEEVPGVPADTSDDDGSDEDGEDRVQDKLITFSKVWLQKFKLVKLLFLSINKSLSSLVSGEKIDQIFAMESAICRSVDMLIVEVMVNKVLDEELTEISKSIDTSCFSIIKLLRDVNKTSENKVKWCASWETKYSELSQEMYRTE